MAKAAERITKPKTFSIAELETMSKEERNAQYKHEDDWDSQCASDRDKKRAHFAADDIQPLVKEAEDAEDTVKRINDKLAKKPYSVTRAGSAIVQAVAVKRIADHDGETFTTTDIHDAIKEGMKDPDTFHAAYPTVRLPATLERWANPSLTVSSKLNGMCKKPKTGEAILTFDDVAKTFQENK